MKQLEIYTDGGCHGNPGPGGWAFVIELDGETQQRSGREAVTTNNRMELTAVIEALKSVRSHYGDKVKSISLVTDSQYVRGGISDWMTRWVRNGWKTSAGKPVKNQDLWQELQRLSHGLNISWDWVRGHSGDRRNELCDTLVQEAIRGSNEELDGS